MPSCKSDSWRRHTLKCLLWHFEGYVGKLLQLGGASEDCLDDGFVELVVRGNYVWCLAIFVIFMELWSTEVGNALKSTFGAMQATRGREQF